MKTKNLKTADYGRKIPFSNLFFVLFLFARKVDGQVSIIPKPNEINYNEGIFNYAKGFDIKIIRGDDATKFIQKQLGDFIKEKNIPLAASSPTAVTLNLLQAKVQTSIQTPIR